MRPPLPSHQSLFPLSLHRPLHLRHLRRHRLADLQIRHLQLSQQIQQHRILFRRQVSLRLHLQCIQHVNEFPRRLRIEHRFASPRVCICTQHHRRIASDHPHQILKRLHLLPPLPPTPPLPRPAPIPEPSHHSAPRRKQGQLSRLSSHLSVVREPFPAIAALLPDGPCPGAPTRVLRDQRGAAYSSSPTLRALAAPQPRLPLGQIRAPLPTSTTLLPPKFAC